MDDENYYKEATAAKESPDGTSAAAAAMTSEENDDGTGDGASVGTPQWDERNEGFDPEMVRLSVPYYVNELGRHELEALMKRHRMNPHGPFVSDGPAFLSKEGSYEQRSLYRSFDAHWDPTQKVWYIRPGKDLRKAYESGFLEDAEYIYVESM